MKYIGIAVGQSITKTATPVTAILAKDGVPEWQEIQTLISEWRPEALILGIPLNMDGTEQPLTFAARRFGDKLKKRFPLPLHFVDERLSTWEAKSRIKNSELLGKSKKTDNSKTDNYNNKKADKKDFKTLNAMSAAVLVEQWLSEN